MSAAVVAESEAPAPPIAEGVFTMRNGQAHLIAGRRKSDGRMRFPMPTGAQAELYEPVELPNAGRLWSFTVQRFRPKAPYAEAGDDRSFRPYAVGYVEFPGAVIAEGRIVVDDFARLRIGMPMRTVVEPFATERGVVSIYAFRPA